MKTLWMVLLFAACAGAQTRPAALPPPPDTTAERGVVLSGQLIVSLSPTAAAFFDAYNKTLGTGVQNFPALTGAGGSVAIDLSPHFSVLLQAQALTLALDDAGLFTVKDTSTGAYGTLSQSTEHWSVQTYPFLAGVRYVPVTSRYQSYCTAAVGVAITHVRWDHSTSLSSDPYQFPSATFETTVAAPTLALGAGVELIFDQFQKKEVLRGLTLEARYRWTESSFNVFGPMAERSSKPAPAWGQSYPMNFSGFELLIGLNLQFYR